MRGFIYKYRQVLHFLLIAASFSLAYTQEPIYNSPEYSDGNQNTKFLHGLAKAGYGLLDEDWLAQTLDPLPAFTFLVRSTYQAIHSEYAFYGYYALLMGVYVYSLLGIADIVFKIKESKAKYLFYLALFWVVHTVNLELGNFDTAWYLHAGVAQQYILGPVFQPCNFGAFILLSIWLFFAQKYLWSAVTLSVAATFHPAYIFSIAVLALSYFLFLLPRESRKAWLFSGVSCVLTLPVFSYTYFRFTATSPELQERATDIIVNFRIPYHAVPDVWLADGTAQIQTLVVIVALYIIRNTQLFKTLFIPFLVAFYLSFFQAIANNNFLAFLSPWRLSVFLVPIATSLIIAALATYVFQVQKQFINSPRLLTIVSLAIVSFLTIQGLNRQIALFNYQGKSTPMLNFVQQSKRSGDVYLVPPNSQPLQKFRLYTGAPIFINKKSHPYKDVEVLEWYSRLNLATNVYDEGDRCSQLKDLSTQYRITHVVSEEARFNCSFLEHTYTDSHYQVSRLELQ